MVFYFKTKHDNIIDEFLYSSKEAELVFVILRYHKVENKHNIYDVENVN